jgi:hypothetical protein
MKKILLTLACLIGLVTSASALDDELTWQTFTSTSATGYGSYTATSTASGVAYSAQFAPSGYIQLRSSNSNSGIVATKSDKKIKSVTITVNGTKTTTARTIDVYGSATAYSAPTDLYKTANAGTKVGSASFESASKGTEFTIDFKYTKTEGEGDDAVEVEKEYEFNYVGIRSNSGAVYLDKIVITYEGEAAKVELPAISLSYDNKVSITTGTEGASIYYTTNGDEPTAESTAYTEPFSISEETTVKAIAILGEDKSNIAEQKLTPYAVYANFADMIKAAPTTTTVFTVSGPLTVAYKNGSNAYVKDSAGNWMLLYSTGGLLADATNGDQYEKVVGKYSPYKNLPEVVPVDAVVKSGSTDALEPEELGIDELATDKANQYVKLTNVTITASETANVYTFTDGEGGDDAATVTAYNTFYNSNYYNPTVTVPIGEGYTVTGFVSVSSDAVQFTPVSFDASAAKQACEAPTFSVQSGKVDKGTEVTITSATEGASIFYTTDGEDPTVSSTLYSEPIVINEDVTIKAIAVKEGFVDSAIATASYTIPDENEIVATFDFSKPTSLSNADDMKDVDFTSNSKEFVLNDVILKNNGVNFKASKGESANSRIYVGTTSGATTVDLRLYTGATVYIGTTLEGKVISSIEFTKVGGNYAWTANRGTFSTSNNDGTWKPKEGDDTSSVIFTVTGTTRVSTIKVYLGDPTTGVSEIAADEDAPAEYFNLQGVRVANPTPGLYIVRKAGQAHKVIIK